MLAPVGTLHSTPVCVVAHLLNNFITIDREKDVFIDIGCGDGRTLNYVSSTFQIPCIGIEIDAKRSLTSLAHPDKVVVHNMNAVEFKEYAQGTILFMFLIKRGLQRILPILLKQCQHKSIRLLTYLYPIPDRILKSYPRVTFVNRYFVNTIEAIPDAKFPIYYYEVYCI